MSNDLQKLTDQLLMHNLCTYFVLPLLSVNKQRFGGESNFLNSYLSEDGTKIYVEIVEPQFIVETNLPKFRLCRDSNKKDYLEFEIPSNFREDLNLFMKGQYSEMSTKAKQLIVEYSGLKYRKLEGTTYKTDIRLLALEKSETLRNFWISELYDFSHQSHISEDMELMSKPDEFSFLTVPLEYIT